MKNTVKDEKLRLDGRSIMKLELEKLHHCYAVASEMKRLAEEQPDKYPVNPNDAYVLAMLHDIGYQFTDSKAEHAHIGAEVLKQQGYKYWEDVYHHEDMDLEYDSDMLRLLRHADKTVSTDEIINGLMDKYCKIY